MTFANESSVLAVGILFVIVGPTIVGARFYVRSIKGGLGVEDWLCLSALIFVVVNSSLMIIGSKTHTVGSHSSPDQTSSIPSAIAYDGSDQQLLAKLEVPAYVIQLIALALIKLSIMFLYRRIFRGRVFNYASWVVIGLVISWAVAFVVAILASCGSHFSNSFKSLVILKTKCDNTFAMLLSLAVTDVVVDLIILVIPIPLVLALQMSLQRRIAVLGILLVGTLAVICGIVRMVFFIEFLDVGWKAPFLKIDGVAPIDTFGAISILMFWGMLEDGVAIIACCLPSLRPLFKEASLESLLRSIRSTLSLRSMESERSVRKRATERLGSQTDLAGFDQRREGDSSCSIGVEMHRMEKVPKSKVDGVEKVPNKIWRETNISQVSEMV